MFYKNSPSIDSWVELDFVWFSQLFIKLEQILYFLTVLHIIGVDITSVTARQTDDFTLDMTTVAVANYNTASIMVTGVLDTVIEGVETLFLCITPNAGVYNIDQPSCTTIYIQGKYLQAFIKIIMVWLIALKMFFYRVSIYVVAHH